MQQSGNIYFTSLNSGSNGNCYYIGTNTDAVLIDAGLTCRETERRMKTLGLNIKNVKAIFISHEHIDHVKGVAGLAEKYEIPIYITPPTQKGCYHLKPQFVKQFLANKPINIGGISVIAFHKFHDAADPHSFIVTYNEITIGVFTDIGSICENVIANFKKCHAIFLEANYDDDMLAKGTYPTFLKNRISGHDGHLSNAQALKLFLHYKPAFMSHIILAHLSKENNSPMLVQQLFEAVAGNIKVTIASRYEAMEVIEIGKDAVHLIKNKNYVQAVLF